MSWIESHATLERHQKLILFAKAMRWSKNEAVGFLHRFWWLVLQYAPRGDVATLAPEVMKDQLDMPSALIARAMSIMERDDIGLLDRRAEFLLVHDWLDYAGTYLRNSLYRRHPERWTEVCELHQVSVDSQTTDARPSTVPTVPTNHNYIKSSQTVDWERKTRKGKRGAC